MKKKIFSLLLVLSLLFSVFATTVSAIVQAPVHTESGTIEGKEDAFVKIKAELAEYQHGETLTVEDDGYIGISVDITVYNDPSVAYVPTAEEEMEYPYDTTEPNYASFEKKYPGGKPVILYVINTNTVRYGTDSDVEIITSLLAEGYVVLVVDYKNEKRSAPPDLDWSLQLLRTKIEEFVGTLPVWATFNYVLPAGYSIKRGVKYFDFEQYAAEGVFEFIVDVWNVDLKYTEGSFGKGHKVTVIWGQKELYDGTLVYQDAEGKRCIPYGDGYAYYTQNADFSYDITGTVANPAAVTPYYKPVTDNAVWTNKETRELQVRYTNAEDWWDCVKLNGERIDLNLYMDIYYPTNPENEVPVMMLASSSQNRAGAASHEGRPISTGYMFKGYAFANYDHAYVPMARSDHFDYFEGDPNLGRDSNFTMVQQTGNQAQTAAVRIVRYLAERYPETFSFDEDRYGVWGHSKGSHINFFSTENPELVPNQQNFPGHNGEVTDEQPWMTYSDGSAIPSNMQFIYSSKGGSNGYTDPDGKVPFFISHPEADTLLSENARYAFILASLRGADTPSFAVTMEGVGHTTVHGYNETLDLDMYQALFDFTDYFLYDRPSTCSYVLPINGTTNVGLTDDIVIKFTGPIPESEILSKVRIINTVTGESVRGTWESACGGNEWVFTPMGLEGGTVYRVYVPEDVIDEKGNAIKAPKTTYFRTSYENAFKAAEVVSTNGSLTLSRTEAGANGVYFIFNDPGVEHSFGATLRFSSTSKASTAVTVYGVTSLDESNPSASVLTAAPIKTVGVAGAEIVEIDVSEYLSTLPEGAKPAFYVEAAKTAGETVIYDVDFDTANGPVSGTKISESPNGTKAYRMELGGAKFLSNVFTSNALTVADYGRLITVTFDVCATADTTLLTRFTLQKVIVPEGEPTGYVDHFNDTGVTKALKAGEWQSVTMTYLIDDYDYVADWIQKKALNFSTASVANAYLYVDNLRVTETVADVTVSDKDTVSSITPTLAFKSAVLNEQPIVSGGYIENGESSDTSFNGECGYLVSGPSQSGADVRVSYFEIDLAKLSPSSPYALVLDVLSGSGKINAYGLSAEALKDFDLDTLTYLSAPGIDRSTASINLADVHEGAAIASVNVDAGTSCVIGLTRYLLDMKAAGQTRAVVMIAADSAESGTFTFEISTGVIKRVINTINFNEMDAFTSTNSRYEVTDDTGAFLQKPNSGDTATAALDESVFYGESGKSLKISNDSSPTHPSPASYASRILRLLNSEPSKAVFTEADLGKTFYVSMKVYIPSLDLYGDDGLKQISIGLTSVSKTAPEGSGQGYYGTAASKMYNPMKLTALKSDFKVGEWNEITYSFTVIEHMLGATPSSYTNDTRPINISFIGTRGDVYVDDLCFYALESIENKEFLPTGSTEVGFTTKNQLTNHIAKGGDIDYLMQPNEDANDGSVVEFSSAKSYDRIYFKGLLETFGMTEENIGDTYTFVLRMKSTNAGTFMMEIGSRNDSVRIPTDDGTVPRITLEVAEEDVGKWLEFEYTFTLTKKTLTYYNADANDAEAGTGKYTGKDKFGLCVRLNGFGQVENPMTLYVDSLKCYRNAPTDDGELLHNVESATLSKKDGVVDGLSASLAKTDEATLRKSYFTFTPSELKNLCGATITVNASKFFPGETLYLWALKGVTMPELLTWNSAPGNVNGEGILSGLAYGEGAIATFTLDENGRAVIDVFEYVQSIGAEDLIFVITSEGGSAVHMQLNLSETESVEAAGALSDGTLTLDGGVLSTNGSSITFENAFNRTTLCAGDTLAVEIVVDTDKEYTLTVDGTGLSYTATATKGTLKFTIEANETLALSTLTLSTEESDFGVTMCTVSEAYCSVLDEPTLSLYTAAAPTLTFDGAVVGHNVVITDTLTYNVYFNTDSKIASIEFGGVSYDFNSLANKQFGEVTYKRFSFTTVAKDAFRMYSITVTLEDGSLAVYDVNIRHYLEQLYETGKDESEKTLAADMLSYLAASMIYFYTDADAGRVNGAIAVRNNVLGADYDASNPSYELDGAIAAEYTDSGMAGAGMNLAEKPTFYFVAAKGYENETPVFMMDGEVVSFIKATEGERTIYYLSFSPIDLTGTVSWTVGDKSGAFNLRTFYDYAKNTAKDENLINLVERLYRYSESVKNYFA